MVRKIGDLEPQFWGDRTAKGETKNGITVWEGVKKNED